MAPLDQAIEDLVAPALLGALVLVCMVFLIPLSAALWCNIMHAERRAWREGLSAVPWWHLKVWSGLVVLSLTVPLIIETRAIAWPALVWVNQLALSLAIFEIVSAGVHAIFNIMWRKPHPPLVNPFTDPPAHTS